jgi:hypothetical protein
VANLAESVRQRLLTMGASVERRCHLCGCALGVAAVVV